MKITNCLSSVAFFLVIVNGQPTTDDDMDRDEIADLKIKKELAESVDRIGKLEQLLTASVDIIAELKGQLADTSAPKPDSGKFNTIP